jgi:hypothetical protein
VITVALALVFVGPAAAAQLVNGGFETGTLENWGLFKTGEHVGWEVLNAEAADSTHAKMKFPPIEGAYSAYTEELEAGTAILYQDVTLEPNATDQLGLIFGYASEGPMVTPAGGSLEVQGGVPNQQLRVDVMKPTAPLESVDPADILATLYTTQTGAPQELAPQVLTADLSRFAGQTVRLRLAMATDSERLNAIVDGVSITSGPLPPPVVSPAPISPSPPAPSNLFTKGKLTLNKQTGRGTLTVNVPDAGTLIAADARRKVAVATRRRKGKAKPKPIYIRSATVTSAGAGTIEVPIRPTATALKVLRQKGSLPVRLTMTFVPVGGAAATQPYSAKLVRRLRPAPAPR